jgi:hypothetical protein
MNQNGDKLLEMTQLLEKLLKLRERVQSDLREIVEGEIAILLTTIETLRGPLSPPPNGTKKKRKILRGYRLRNRKRH